MRMRSSTPWLVVVGLSVPFVACSDPPRDVDGPSNLTSELEAQQTPRPEDTAANTPALPRKPAALRSRSMLTFADSENDATSPCPRARKAAASTVINQERSPFGTTSAFTELADVNHETTIEGLSTAALKRSMTASSGLAT